ncbi:hypothetical protein ACFYVL_39175 [Streptomyces sp. NPDC004111]|uniref:hypothetical protein n=1 Tax=Streptomyces sp. NPDC004111 TaxID=3364690 RepID=UPI00367E6EE5
MPPRYRPRHRALAAATLLLTVWLPALSAPTAHAATSTDPTATRQADFLARKLAGTNVYVSDQLPRELPRSEAPRLARAAARTGVPTYVIALPQLDGPQQSQLLDAVHLRLKRDGLYVLLTANLLAEARTYGVPRLPQSDVSAAARAARYEQPVEDPAAECFERFVDVLASGRAQERARADEEKYGSGDEPEPPHTTADQRRGASGRLGLALGAVPTVLLTLIVYVRTQRQRGAR